MEVFWTPDFPNFSFEYDPEYWTIERQDQERSWHIIASHLSTGGQLTFTLFPSSAVGFGDTLHTFAPDEVAVVGDKAVRVFDIRTVIPIQDAYLYLPRNRVSFCEIELETCKERWRSYYGDWEPGVYAVSDYIFLFETLASSEFIEQLELRYPEANYSEVWGKYLWFVIDARAFGKDIPFADTIVATLKH